MAELAETYELNVAPEPRAGVAQFAHTALSLYYQTEEAMEGRNAFVEKRPVNFGKFREYSPPRRMETTLTDARIRPGAGRRGLARREPGDLSRPVGARPLRPDGDRDGWGRLSYETLARRVERVAHGLRCPLVETEGLY